MSTELRKKVNDTIIQALVELRVPWRGDFGFPRNIATKLRYDGVNPLLLNIATEHCGWTTCYWGTYDQWLSRRCYAKPQPPHVKIWEWFCDIVLYKPQFAGKLEQELGSWTVFNLDQIASGFDELRTFPKPLDYDAVDKIIESTNADIRHEPGLEAAYYYADDYIVFPFKEQFVQGGPAGYYHSLFHELVGHWSETRLGVDFGPVGNELRAEICADYLCTELGIPRLDVSKRTNHKNSLDKWVKMMREDPDLIFRVTASASKAVDLILSFSRVVEPRHNSPAEISQPYSQSSRRTVPQVSTSSTTSSGKQESPTEEQFAAGSGEAGAELERKREQAVQRWRDSGPATVRVGDRELPTQEQFTFHSKDQPGPSAEQRYSGLGDVYQGCHAKSEAIKVLQGIAFDALAKYNHVTNEVHVALVGPAGSERADLIRRHNKARKLPLVEVVPSRVKTALDIVNQIADVALFATIPLIELGRKDHYILPPMDIVLDDFHALPDDVRQRLGNAIEHGTLETEMGHTVDCKSIHWIIAVPDSDSLSRAFDSRLTILHTTRLVTLTLSSEGNSLAVAENVRKNETHPVEQPKEEPSCKEELPATLKFPEAIPSGASSQQQLQAENLRRWRESGHPRAWVEAHQGTWNHGDWLELLETLKRFDFWPLDSSSIGNILEEHRKEWKSSVRPAESEGQARNVEQQQATDSSPMQPSGQEQTRDETGRLSSKPLALPTDHIAELRQQLTAYAASLLGPEANEFKEFGNTVTITDVASCYVYHTSCDTTWEKRELVKKEKPFDGATPKNPTVTENGLNVWSYSLPSDNKQAGEYTVSGSDKAIACDKCGASGQVSCRKCDGSGYIRCPKCNGTQQLRCSACKGSGYSERKEVSGQKKVRCSDCKGYGYTERQEWSGQQRTQCGTCYYWGRSERCNDCGGLGYKLRDIFRTVRDPCTTCSGTGSVSEDVYGKVRYSCGTCDGEGAVDCLTCYKDGTVDCGTCKKKGVVSCSPCKGKGYTGISYFAIKRSVSSTITTGHSTDSTVSQDTLERLLKPSDYDEVVSLTEQEFRNDFSMSLSLPDTVKEWVQKAIADSRQSTVTGTRIVKQRLRVAHLAAAVCQYTHCGKKYTFTSLGKRKVPFATNSPISEYLEGRKEIDKLRGTLKKTAFEVWLGGLPLVLSGLAGCYLLIWTPLAGLLYLIVRPEEGTVLNSISDLWWPGIGTSLFVIVGIILWYNLFADKESLEKKRAEINAPILARIKELEAELDNIRQGTEPHEDGRESNSAGQRP